MHVSAEKQPDTEELDTLWQQHSNATLALLDFVTRGVYGWVLRHDDGGSEGDAPPAAATTLRVTVTRTSDEDGAQGTYHARVDAAMGRYYQPLPPGAYAVVASAVEEDGTSPYLPQTRFVTVRAEDTAASLHSFALSTRWGDGSPGPPPSPPSPPPPPPPLPPPPHQPPPQLPPPPLSPPPLRPPGVPTPPLAPPPAKESPPPLSPVVDLVAAVAPPSAAGADGKRTDTMMGVGLGAFLVALLGCGFLWWRRRRSQRRKREESRGVLQRHIMNNPDEKEAVSMHYSATR